MRTSPRTPCGATMTPIANRSGREVSDSAIDIETGAVTLARGCDREQRAHRSRDASLATDDLAHLVGWYGQGHGYDAPSLVGLHVDVVWVINQVAGHKQDELFESLHGTYPFGPVVK